MNEYRKRRLKEVSLTIVVVILSVVAFALELFGYFVYTSLALTILKICFYVSIAAIIMLIVAFFKNFDDTNWIVKLLEIALFIGFIVVGIIILANGRLAIKAFTVSEQYGVVYAETKQGYSVWKIEDKVEDVYIFTTMDGKSVTRIDKKACKDNEVIKSITFDKGNLTIEDEAFKNCPRLVSVTLDNNSEYVVCANAFAECIRLTDFNVGNAKVTTNSTTSVGVNVFTGSPYVTVNIEGGSLEKVCGEINKIVCGKNSTVICASGGIASIPVIKTIVFKDGFDFTNTDFVRYDVNLFGSKGDYYGVAEVIYLPVSITKIPDNFFGNIEGNIKVNYAGTQAQWEKLTIGSTGNSNYTNGNVTVAYNSSYQG